jgi:hypothetical protein
LIKIVVFNDKRRFIKNNEVIFVSDKRKCALYGYEASERLNRLIENLKIGKQLESTYLADNTYDSIIKLESLCDANLENSRNAMYKIKDFIDKKQYLYAADIVDRLMSNIREESVMRQLRR